MRKFCLRVVCFIAFVAIFSTLAKSQRQGAPVTDSDWLPEFVRPRVTHGSSHMKADPVSMPVLKTELAPFFQTVDNPESFHMKRSVTNDSVGSGIIFSTASSFGCAGLACVTPFEPVVAAAGSNVFVTGNFLNVRSNNGGTTWAFSDPSTTHPSFCCDQDVVYTPVLRRFLWWRQGYVDGASNMNNNTLVASALDSTTPQFLWVLNISNFDPTLSGVWMDFPRIDVTNKYMFIVTNLFDINGYFGTGVGRIPLADINSGGNLRIDYIQYSQNMMGLATGVNMDTMWYIGQRPAAYCCVIFRWDDESPFPVSSIQSVAYVYFNKGWSSCPDSFGGDPCSTTDSKIQAGWYSPTGVVGFVWMQMAQPQFGLPNNFIGYATFNASTLQVIVADGAIASNSHHLVYPAAAGGSGSKPAVAFYGVGVTQPHYFAISSVGSDRMRTVFQSNVSLPLNAKWGDYTRLRPYHPDNTKFVAVGYRVIDSCVFSTNCTSGIEGVYIIFNATTVLSPPPSAPPVALPTLPPQAPPQAPPKAAPVASPTVAAPQRPPQVAPLMPPQQPPQIPPQQPPQQPPQAPPTIPPISPPQQPPQQAPVALLQPPTEPPVLPPTPAARTPVGGSGSQTPVQISNTGTTSGIDAVGSVAVVIGVIGAAVAIALVVVIVLKKQGKL